MRYEDQDRESKNLEDRRDESGGGGFRFPGGGGGLQIPMGGGGFSITTLLIVGALMLFFGINPLDILTGGGGGFPDLPQLPRSSETAPGRPAGSQRSPFELPGKAAQGNAGEEEMKKFVGRVLADTEDVWNALFKSFGRTYKEPNLVLFRGSYPTACGRGVAAMGPFYCPGDQKVYIDLSFYEELKRRFNAPGDFAQAYVIAHEIGHHVQALFGIAEKVQAAKEQMSERKANELQVRMELQADCFAGVWANRNNEINKRLEPGDVEEGLRAASQIGDDMIQKRATGRVVPDAFTHGSSKQRVEWFARGLKSGDIQSCDTFTAAEL